MQGHGRIIAPDFCVAHREANSGLSTLNRTKSILSIYHQQRQLQKQRGMCLNDTYPFCQQPLSGNCHSICFSKPVLWTATPGRLFSEQTLVKADGIFQFCPIGVALGNTAHQLEGSVGVKAPTAVGAQHLRGLLRRQGLHPGRVALLL